MYFLRSEICFIRPWLTEKFFKGLVCRTETTGSVCKCSLRAKNNHNVLIASAEYMICLLYIARLHVLSHLIFPPHKSLVAVCSHSVPFFK